MGRTQTEKKIKHFNTPKTARIPQVWIHPIPHFTEHDVWEAIHKYGIPFCNLYERGYRALDSRYCSCKSTDLPAWQQDLKNTPERITAQQNEEIIMNRLRDLGYL